jgi:hypothetical protein
MCNWVGVLAVRHNFSIKHSFYALLVRTWVKFKAMMVLVAKKKSYLSNNQTLVLQPVAGQFTD